MPERTLIPVSHPARRRRLMTALLACLLAAGVVTAAGEGGDPVPIRRLLLPAERVPAEMKRLEQGALVRLSRADFEARVRAAARGRKTRAKGPRLVEARYRASLVDESLVGSAEWKVVHAGPGAGLLPLQQPPQAFNLALQQPRFQNRDALVAAFDGRNLALLVDQPGEHAVALEWSARSEDRPEGLHFDLKVPPCPLASLELNLPADRVVALLDGALVSGPFPAETADRRLWKVVCSGRPQVDLLVRPAPGSPGAQPALLLARQKTVQKLSPEGVEATFEFTLESLHQGMRELVLECDPMLRPTDVVIADLDSWELRPGGPPKTPGLLTVRLREPLQQGTLQVHCIAPLGGPPRGAGGFDGPQPFDWTSLGMRLLGAVPRGESLDLVLSSELRAEDWRPGGFRLVETSASGGPGPRSQTLTLLGGGVVPDGAKAGMASPRPRVRLRARGVEFRAVQKAWWRLGPGGMALTLQVAYEVSQGQLFQLPLLLPAGWEVEQVDLNPPNWLRASGVHHVGGRDVLQVDLRKPLTVGGTGRGEGAARRLVLTVRLRPMRVEAMTGRELPFPDVESPGARFREGTLAVDFDEQVYEPFVKTTAPRAATAEDGPWGKHVPDYVFRYRGAPVVGTLRLDPRPPRVRAQSSNSVFVAAGRAVVETRLSLWAEVGSPETVELEFSALGGGPREWRAEPGRGGVPPGNRVRRAERLDGPEGAVADALGALAASDPLRAALQAARPGRDRWRLTLERPLRVNAPLVLLATRKVEPQGNRWEVPLPTMTGAGRMEGEVTLHLAGDLVHPETVGLRAAPAATAWRTFRYGPGPVRLALRGQVLAADRSREAVAGPACLTTFLGGDGVAEHHFTFSVASWPQRTLPVRLPAGARLVAAQVDGCWLPWLVTPATEGRETVDLPVPDRDGTAGEGPYYVFEVIYRGTGSEGEEAPVLPVTPLSLRRRWRSAPGVSPLLDGRQLRLPGAEEGLMAGAGRRGLGDLFRFGAGLRPTWLGTDRTVETQRLLTDAALRVRRGARPGQTVTLRDLVDQVAFEFLRGRQPLVVDTAALRQAGLDGATRLPLRPVGEGEDAKLPWEERGVVALPMGPATLLTTRAQEDLWRPAAGGPVALSPPLSRALGDAVARGRDATGRFRSALDWLRPRRAGSTDREMVAPLLAPEGAAAPWEEWAPRAGSEGGVVPLVRRRLATAAGLAAMTFLCLMLWWGRRLGTRRLLAFLLLWLAAAGLGVLWLPTVLQDVAWWPLLAGCVVALAWYLLTVLRGTPAPRAKTVTGTSVTAGLVLLAVAGQGAPPAAPAPATVYLLGGPADKQTVLAPPELLDRLAALAAPPAAPTGALLVAADYDGKVVDGAADFGAVFVAHSLTDGPATLVLPLAGVRLYGEVWLDGARAFPETLPRPRSGYALTVRGRGRHKIELRFRVPVTGSAGDRNVSFTAPRLAQNRLGLSVPPGATALQALVRHGAGRIKAEAVGPRLDVALGAVGIPLHFRWRQEARPPVRAQVQYQEAYLWDLRPDASSLTALLHYRVPRGAITGLRIGLPPELEVRTAEAHRVAPPGPASASAGVRLRDWRVTGAAASRALELTFPGPVQGEFDVTLQLVPRGPLPATVTLPLPEPQGQRLPQREDKGKGGYLAYQTVGLEAHRGSLLRVQGIPAAEFAPFWPAASRPDPRNLAYAATIGREPGGHPPMLGLHLHLPPPVVEAAQDIEVRVGPDQAEVRAKATLTAPHRDLSLVEWEINSPRPLTVASVSGPNVLRWNRQGNRLLVWLRQTGGTATLNLSGWVPLAPGGPKKAPHLELPSLRVVGTRSQQTNVRLLAGSGLRLLPEARQNLWPLPDPRLTTSERTYVARDGPYGGRWLVQPGAGPSVQVLTVAELRDRQLRFHATLDYVIPQGELRTVELRLRNWEGKVERLEGRGAEKASERHRRVVDRSWAVELQPPAAGHYRLTLRGSMPAEAAAGGVRMPELTVAGVARAEYRLAVVGKDLRALEATGLAALANPGKTLAAWPQEAERVRRKGGRAWRVAAPNWGLRLVPRGQAVATPARVLLTEQKAVVVDGRHWLHEAVYWLRHETHTDLYVSFPKQAEVVAVSVDGREMAPLQPEPSRLWLPLPGRAGVCRVRLRWRYDESEGLGQPNLLRPLLEGADEGPAVWTVCVPAGWLVGKGPSGGSLGSGATRSAALALYRAEAQLRVSEALAEQGGGANEGLSAAQQRFYQECRHAGRALEAGADGGAGPSGQAPGDWLRDLRQRNAALAARHGFEAVRKEAEARAARDAAPPEEVPPADEAATPFTGLVPGRASSAAGAPLPEWGLPFSWYVAPGGQTPQVQLVPEEDGRIRAALAASVQWLALLAGVWLIALSPTLTSRLRPLWPEAFVLLGVVGWELAGLTLVVLVLVLVGVCGRLLLLGRWLSRLLPRPAVAVVGTSHNSRP